VSDVEAGVDRISFRVDRPGSPVVVRASYFPNWQVDGAEGPYRISPNLMAVVPTQEQVTLSYGTTWVDRLGWFLTISGLVLVGILAVDDQRRREALLAADGHGDEPAGDGPAGDGPAGDGPAGDGGPAGDAPTVRDGAGGTPGTR
jgi:hypothetical protein